MTAPSVVVAGGHSAGHIEPAMNLADAVCRLDPTARITALGTERGLDTTLIPARGYDLELIPPVPLPRRVSRALLETPGKLSASVTAAREVLERVGAEVVVGFGGYVAMPAYVAAKRLRLPIVVHEANAKAGVANRVAARMTDHVFTASPAVRLQHGVPIGIPLRPAISLLNRATARPQALERFGLRDDLPVLLVTGGSQGAQSLNRVVTASADEFSAAGVQVLHVTGRLNLEDVQDQLLPSGAGPDADVPYVTVPYVDAMEEAYAAADFVLCRSGAMTVAELTAVGLPAAYVPLPLRGGEQRLNAEPVVAAGAGLLVDNDRLTSSWIAEEVIARMIDPPRLAAMASAAEDTGSRGADVVLARAVLDVVAEYRRFGATA